MLTRLDPPFPACVAADAQLHVPPAVVFADPVPGADQQDLALLILQRETGAPHGASCEVPNFTCKWIPFKAPSIEDNCEDATAVKGLGENQRPHSHKKDSRLQERKRIVGNAEQ